MVKEAVIARGIKGFRDTEGGRDISQRVPLGCRRVCPTRPLSAAALPGVQLVRPTLYQVIEKKSEYPES
jgi:hypothetical protein